MASSSSSSSSFHSLLHRHPHPHPHPKSSFRSTSSTTSLSFLSRASSSSSPTKPSSSRLSSCSLTSSSHSSPVTSAPSPSSTSLDSLSACLSSGDFRGADEETRRLLIALAGDAALKRGYVFFSEVRSIPAADLRAIDDLWREHSGGRFGYRVQRRLWDKQGRDFTRLFIKLGWMKRLDSSEVEQYSYQSFPDEFTWELSDGVPEGHLPLTNALRGTQLFASILTHPAFAPEDDGDEPPEEAAPAAGGFKNLQMGTTFKTDYSF